MRLNDEQTIRLMRYNDPLSILPAPSLSMRLTFIRSQFSRSLVRNQKRSRFLRSGRCLISEDTASWRSRAFHAGINFAIYGRQLGDVVDGAFELRTVWVKRFRFFFPSCFLRSNNVIQISYTI